MVSIVLMTVPFVVGAQEQIFDLNREAFDAKLTSCIYRQDCYELDDIQKETATVQLIGVKCPESETGFGQVFVYSPKWWTTSLSGSFETHGLEFSWRVKDMNSEHEPILFIVRNDGTGSYYEDPKREEGMSTEPNEIYACVDRSDEAVDFLKGILGYQDAK